MARGLNSREVLISHRTVPVRMKLAEIGRVPPHVFRRCSHMLEQGSRRKVMVLPQRALVSGVHARHAYDDAGDCNAGLHRAVCSPVQARSAYECVLQSSEQDLLFPSMCIRILQRRSSFF